MAREGGDPAMTSWYSHPAAWGWGWWPGIVWTILLAGAALDPDGSAAA
jgi:hypothetical protein